jgi:hypothetical protein
MNATELKAFVEAAKAGDRAAAIEQLKALYEPDHPRAIHDALRELMTYPEFALLPTPPEEVDPRRVAPRSFGRMLGGALTFPFSSIASITVILLGGLLFAGSMALLRTAGCIALPILAAATGYVVAFWFNVVVESATGSLKAPGWPAGEDYLDYIGHFLRWWLATIAASLPALVLLGVWIRAAERSESAAILFHPALIGTFVAGAVGVLYYPMALLLAAFGGAWWAPLNLPAAITGIRKLAGDYFLCVGFFVVTFAAATAVEIWLQRTFTGVSVVLARMAASWVTFTMTVVQMRALGLMYYARSRDLNWYR